MVEKDSVYHRSSAYLSRHSDLQPRMRAILLDWLMEVLVQILTLFRIWLFSTSLTSFPALLFMLFTSVYFSLRSFVFFAFLLSWCFDFRCARSMCFIERLSICLLIMWIDIWRTRPTFIKRDCNSLVLRLCLLRQNSRYLSLFSKFQTTN